MFKPGIISSKASSITYATWNPTDNGAITTLSGGNLIAENNTSAVTHSCARSTVSKSSGKWYWEYNILSSSSGNICVGIGNSSADMNALLGLDINGWGYYNSTGQKINNSGLTAYGGTYTSSDVIGVALDMDGGNITFYKNNTSQGVAFSGLSGSIFAMVSLRGTSGGRISANFGASALTYSPPSGFNAGLYI